VLAQTGILGILEFRPPCSDSLVGGLANVFVRLFVPLVDILTLSSTGEYAYLADSILAFPGNLHPELEKNGFYVIKTDDFLGGLVRIYLATPL
jgi:ubiquinone/menaquinone biosynthesis C-methylase UbiE